MHDPIPYRDAGRHALVGCRHRLRKRSKSVSNFVFECAPRLKTDWNGLTGSVRTSRRPIPSLISQRQFKGSAILEEENACIGGRLKANMITMIPMMGNVDLFCTYLQFCSTERLWTLSCSFWISTQVCLQLHDSKSELRLICNSFLHSLHGSEQGWLLASSQPVSAKASLKEALSLCSFRFWW